MTTVVVPEVIGARQHLTTEQVRKPAEVDLAENLVRLDVEAFLREHGIEPFGQAELTWVLQASATGYRRPQGVSEQDWRDIVREYQGRTDHFGKPESIVIDHYIEEPHRD